MGRAPPGPTFRPVWVAGRNSVAPRGFRIAFCTSVSRVVQSRTDFFAPNRTPEIPSMRSTARESVGVGNFFRTSHGLSGHAAVSFRNPSTRVRTRSGMRTREARAAGAPAVLVGSGPLRA